MRDGRLKSKLGVVVVEQSEKKVKYVQKMDEVEMIHR